MRGTQACKAVSIGCRNEALMQAAPQRLPPTSRPPNHQPIQPGIHTHMQARRHSGCAAPTRRHWRHTSCAVASAVMGSRSKMCSSSSSGSTCSMSDSSPCKHEQREGRPVRWWAASRGCAAQRRRTRPLHHQDHKRSFPPAPAPSRQLNITSAKHQPRPYLLLLLPAAVPQPHAQQRHPRPVAQQRAPRSTASAA